jgi:alkylation response protein AidB-like acyl-CoA dehydrogenase
MRFELTAEQEQFAQVVREFFVAKFPATALRAIWDGGGVADTGVWPGLAELGALGIVIPENAGGSGAGHVELALLLEECGYAAFPEPVLETAGIAAPLLLRFADNAVRSQWLPLIASGGARIAVADESGFAPWGAQADATLVRQNGVVHLVPAGRAEWLPVATQDPTRLVARADSSRLGPDTVLTADPRAAGYLDTLGLSATAAALVGVTGKLLDMTLGYVLERNQFGRPVGSFQAVKHRLADLAVGLEAARALTWYAAWALSAGDDAAGLAAMTAKSAAADAARFANRNSLQLHGGIGFTWECDLHFWLMRGQAWEVSFGHVSRLRDAIGRAVLARADGPVARES